MTCKSEQRKMERFVNANNLVRGGKIRHNYEELQIVLQYKRLGNNIPGKKVNIMSIYVRKKM